MKVLRDVILSPGHGVMPYSITPTDDGDFIVAGALGLNGLHSWATRMGPTGRVIWDFLDGPLNGWTDDSARGEQFYSALGLEGRKTLLCGGPPMAYR